MSFCRIEDENKEAAEKASLNSTDALFAANPQSMPGG
jgi:hypothetical protein